jgi:hypothetical protein
MFQGRSGDHRPMLIRRRVIAVSLSLALAVGSTGAVATSAASAAKPKHVVIGGKVKPGGKCAKGVAGCRDGEFIGDFFGD